VLIAGVVPGLWPAIAAARVDVMRVLGSQGGSLTSAKPSRLPRRLVGAQIAGSTAFLALAILLAQTYGYLSLADLGFDTDRLVVTEFEPASHGYDADRSARYVASLLARVRALPGVTGAAVADRVPFFIGFNRTTSVSSSGTSCEPDACAKYATMAVGPAYFETMGIPLTAGREFEWGGAPNEVIINQPLARAQWPDGRGVGETLRIGERGIIVTVIGITAKTHTRGLDREEPTLYVPMSPEHLEGPLSVVARTARAPEPLVRPITEAAQALDSNVSMLAVKTMRQRMAVQLWPFRTVSWLFSICGALALVLSTVGLAGVVIHGVNRRLREFGVRISMGATPRDLVFDVLRSSAAMLVPGLVAGTLLAVVVARLARVAFIGVDVLNPVTYLGVTLLECVVVLIACIGPALRASQVDPLVALRSL
jgi:putative ABC transport system permease protein